MMGKLNLKNFLYFLGFHFICWSLNQLACNFSNIALNGSPPAKTLLAIFPEGFIIFWRHRPWRLPA
jgi:hypothetical protein